MALAPGQDIGPYRIVGKLGEGGMGEVYSARDTRLNRDVAIKALPESVANDPERVARFEREAQILAALRHPGIAGIHGLEQAGPARYLVLEYVEGESLAQRLSRGAMPIDDALAVARQIADALEAAHEKGVIHRDLKPGNIMLAPDGTVKVLDFGLAKALAPDGSSSSSDTMNSPTLTAATAVGVILGTAAYMSPEQAKGRPADKRSDVWGFGCVLFELLTGTRAFAGEDVSDTLAAVLRAEPDWSLLPRSTPVPIVQLVKRCLVKDRRQRIPDISVARFEIDEWISGRSSAAAPAVAVASPRRARTVLLVMAAAIAGAVAGAVAIYSAFWPAPQPGKIARFLVDPPSSAVLRTRTTGPGIDIAVSPDGSKVVYRVETSAGDALALRELGGSESVVLTATRGATNSFSLSPDGRALVFFGDGKLQSFEFGSSKPATVVELATTPYGTQWLSAGEIVFASAQGKLFRVGASGGTPELLAEPPAPEEASNRNRQYVFPEVVPGSDIILYTSAEGTKRRIEARRLSATEPKIIVEDASFPKITAAGHLLFLRGDRLMAARFDASTLGIVGQPVVLDENVGPEKNRGGSSFDVADDGTFVAIAAPDVRYMSRFVWKSRDGRTLGYVGPAGMEAPRYPRLSHDGRRLVATVGGVAKGQIWVFDLVGEGQPQKLTFDGHHVFPMWSPDDRQLVFWSDVPERNTRTLHRMPADGSQLTPTALGQMRGNVLGDLGPDGTSLLFITQGPETQWDLSLFKIGSNQTATPWLAERFSDIFPAFSPDGKWVAYVSSQNGPLEIWVRPFPGPGAPVRISAAGGIEPIWSRDGREVFYQFDGKLYAVPITVAGASVKAGPTRLLFEGGFVGFENNSPRTYDVARDGRFLMIEEPNLPNEASRGTVSVTIGFDEVLRQRVK